MTSTETPLATAATATAESDDAERDSRPAILFVDDEEQVLDSLRVALRRGARAYRMLYANGGTEALDVLARESVDVLVTDVRMPGMNGVQLLEAVRQQHPTTIRYVLSGEAEPELVVRAIPVAHRWLAKPCGRKELLAALESAVGHRRMIDNPEVHHALSAATSLPSPPDLYSSVLALLADPEASIDTIADLVAGDPAVTTKLLQWANSAYSGGTTVTDVRSAIARVGLRALTQLVLSVDVFRSLRPDEQIPGLDIETLDQHGSAIGQLASHLAGADDSSVAGLGGLFTFVGLLLEASHLPDRLAAAYQRAETDGISLVQAEQELYQLTHPELGAHLLSVWGLPSTLVLATAGAHELPDLDQSLPLDAMTAIRAARLHWASQAADSGLGAPHLGPIDAHAISVVTSWVERAGS